MQNKPYLKKNTRFKLIFNFFFQTCPENISFFQIKLQTEAATQGGHLETPFQEKTTLF